MHRWLPPALDYIPQWLEFQMASWQQPGCIVAIGYRGKVIFERAFGAANLDTGEALTPRHRFRVASHTKSFTAAGIMLLRERGKLRLDDTAGQYVFGPHPAVTRATIAQLLSHSAGLIRDGSNSDQFSDRRPFLNMRELMADLAKPPMIEPNTRLKYSNHGYALAGLVIEAVTGEPYAKWIKREVIDAAGLEETQPDMPLRRGTPFARGHTRLVVTDRRLVIPGDFSLNAITPAGGFASTAGDLVSYFAQLSPLARKSFLSVASRREMVRRQWRNLHSAIETYYGLGIMSSTFNGWDWFGHTGGLQGYISCTRMIPQQELSISVLTNAVDGWATPWVDGIMHILQAYERNGAPTRATKAWTGRWWTLWGPVDLLPMGNKVMLANPGFLNPLFDASEVAVASRMSGRIALAQGYGSPGEPVRCSRTKSGRMTELWLGAARLLPAARLAKELEARYGGTKQKRRKGQR